MRTGSSTKRSSSTATAERAKCGSSLSTIRSGRTTSSGSGRRPAPIISEFALRDPGGDITEEVLRTEGRLYMICIASFDRVRHGCAHRLRMLIERADREGASVLCLTPGPLDEEARHAFLGSRLVRCCNIDVHTLKTLLRANNGVVVLEDGVITAKMNCRDIPL